MSYVLCILIDALNNQIKYQYDKNSNIVNLQQIEVDPSAQFLQETYTWQLEYDQLNRAIKLTDNLNNISTTKYDSRNNTTEKTDALNNITKLIYDGKNRLLQEDQYLSQSGAGGTLDTSNPNNIDGIISNWLTYDDNSRITALIDDNNNSTTYRYDALNR